MCDTDIVNVCCHGHTVYCCHEQQQHLDCPWMGQRADRNFLESTFSKKIPNPPTLVHIGPLPALNVAKRIWKMHCAIYSRTGCRGKQVTLLANILHTTTHFPALIKMVHITICYLSAHFIMLEQHQIQTTHSTKADRSFTSSRTYGNHRE